MTKIFVFLSLSLFLACNFSIDPRNAGDDEGGEEEVAQNKELFYTVTYQEFDKTISYRAGSGSLLGGEFLAENVLMEKDPTTLEMYYTKKDVEPADVIETSTLYQNKEDIIPSTFAIPKITVEEIPTNVSRATGFEIKLGGETIEKGDFVDLELYDPETKESVAMYSLLPSIPGMENTVSIDGSSIKISAGFMAWFSEFESGKTYLLSINRAPGGWIKEKNLNYIVNYQIKYSSAQHVITVVP